MEKSRSIWNPTRSLLGLILFGVTFTCSLNAKEIFDVPFRYSSGIFEFGDVKTVSFYCVGHEGLNFDKIVESIGQGKADVVITGEKGIEGKALSPNISIDVVVRRNVKEKAYLVMIDAHVNGEAKKAFNKFEKQFSGPISIESHVLAFSDSKQPQEIEKAITNRLQDLVNTITNSAETRPTFFVVH